MTVTVVWALKIRNGINPTCASSIGRSDNIGMRMVVSFNFNRKLETMRNIKRKMFSGIVEEMAECKSLIKLNSITLWDGSKSEGVELTVKLNGESDVLSDAYIGCSIAINGCCLTATSIDPLKKEFTGSFK